MLNPMFPETPPQGLEWVLWAWGQFTNFMNNLGASHVQNMYDIHDRV